MSFNANVLSVFVRRWFFLWIPLLSGLLAATLRLATGPYWLSPNSDPAYMILLNSLYYFRGVTSSFTDLPGTTIHMLFVAVFWILNPLKSPQGIIDAVLVQPEFYLNAAFWILWGLFFGTLIVLGWSAYRFSGSKIFALLLQGTAFFYLTLKSFGSASFVLPVTANITGENLQITMINLAMIALLWIFWKEKKSLRPPSIILIAGIFAAGIATKYTFMTLIVLPLAVLPRWKHRSIFLTALVVWFFVLLIPIWNRLEETWKWLMFVLFPPGDRGAASGFLQLFSSYISGWNWVLSTQKFYVGFLLLAVLSLVLRRCNGRFALPDRVAFWAAVAALVHLMAVARHPGPQYLAPGLAALGMAAAFSYLGWRDAGFTKARAVGTWVVVLFIGTGTFYSLIYRGKLASEMGALASFHRHLHEQYSPCKILGYYRSSGPEYALKFGDERNGRRILARDLGRLYPGWYFFHIYTYRVGDWVRDVSMSHILAESPCVVFQGSCGYRFDLGPYETELIGQEGDECAYRLVRSSETQAVRWFILADALAKTGDYNNAYRAIKTSLDDKFFPDNARLLLEKICGSMTETDEFHLCIED